MSIWLTILLNFILPLLVKFIEALIEKWLHPQPALALAEYKDTFVEQVRKRWWLGPKRVDVASKLYDKAVANYAKSSFVLPLTSAPLTSNEKAAIVRTMTNGLTLEPSEL